MSEIIDAIPDPLIDIATLLFWCAFWLIGGFYLARYARVWVGRTLSTRSVGWSGTILVSRLVSIAIRVLSVLPVLNLLGVSGTGLLAVVSAFTVAIGLSLQDVMKNFFAGIYLLLERPFKVGDRIVVRDVFGQVQAIDIRTTHIKNVDNELVLVPNATIFTEILRNDTYFGVRRVELTITTDSRSASDVRDRLTDALVSTDVVKQPIPEPRIISRDATHLKLTSSLMIDNTDAAQNEVAQAVIDALPGDTIEVASK
jgi:small-conductance mechanosensitive channel